LRKQVVLKENQGKGLQFDWFLRDTPQHKHMAELRLQLFNSRYADEV